MTKSKCSATPKKKLSEDCTTHYLSKKNQRIKQSPRKIFGAICFGYSEKVFIFAMLIIP